jgi:hypothetical protein
MERRCIPHQKKKAYIDFFDNVILHISSAHEEQLIVRDDGCVSISRPRHIIFFRKCLRRDIEFVLFGTDGIANKNTNFCIVRIPVETIASTRYVHFSSLIVYDSRQVRYWFGNSDGGRYVDYLETNHAGGMFVFRTILVSIDRRHKQQQQQQEEEWNSSKTKKVHGMNSFSLKKIGSFSPEKRCVMFDVDVVVCC